jgi:hypothetical protein
MMLLAPVTNWELHGVTLAGYRYAMRQGMKVQIVTPYRVSHLQRHGVTVRGNVTCVYPTLDFTSVHLRSPFVWGVVPLRCVIGARRCETTTLSRHVGYQPHSDMAPYPPHLKKKETKTPINEFNVLLTVYHRDVIS